MRGVAMALALAIGLLWACADDDGSSTESGLAMGQAGVDASRSAETAGNVGAQPDRDAATMDVVFADAGGGVRAAEAGTVGLDAGRPAPASPGFDASTVCVDVDGDGFGDGCPRGADCDDDDVAVTDACYRCVEPNVGCPCELGTRPVFCTPPDLHVDGGVLVCSEGSRYCRDGAWTECEALVDYVFVPST